MQLSASLTTLTALALCSILISACAGNSPRKPATTQEKSSRDGFYNDCFDAQSRGAAPPFGCPQNRETRRSTRTLPSIEREPMTLPNLPGPGSVGGVLGR